MPKHTGSGATPCKGTPPRHPISRCRGQPLIAGMTFRPSSSESQAGSAGIVLFLCTRLKIDTGENWKIHIWGDRERNGGHQVKLGLL